MRIELEVNGIKDRDDEIYESERPWMHPPDSYAIAITGKAFNKLVGDPTQKGVLQQVLLKA
jgi:hypothetical protein